MRILVDTPVWSAALRRSEAVPNPYRDEMRRIVSLGIVDMIGPIRQEVLSGVKDSVKFTILKERLSSFPDLSIATEDYEEAASLYNRCRSKGIQGSGTDLLICAVSIRYNLAIFTDDKDFSNYRKVIPIRLHQFGKSVSSPLGT